MECSSPPLFSISNTPTHLEGIRIPKCHGIVLLDIGVRCPVLATSKLTHALTPALLQKTHSCHHGLYCDYGKPYLSITWLVLSIAVKPEMMALQIHVQGITVIIMIKCKWSHKLGYIGSSSSSRLAQDKPTFAVRWYDLFSLHTPLSHSSTKQAIPSIESHDKKMECPSPSPFTNCQVIATGYLSIHNPIVMVFYYLYWTLGARPPFYPQIPCSFSPIHAKPIMSSIFLLPYKPRHIRSHPLIFPNINSLFELYLSLNWTSPLPLSSRHCNRLHRSQVCVQLNVSKVGYVPFPSPHLHFTQTLHHLFFEHAQDSHPLHLPLFWCVSPHKTCRLRSLLPVHEWFRDLYSS